MTLERVLAKPYIDRSEAREVMADHTQTAFGTPMFSQRQDAGYDGLFLTWPEQLLLDCFVASGTSTVVTMPLGSIGKVR
jgi:hypothetical protein